MQENYEEIWRSITISAEDQIEIGRKLQFLRKSRGLTQEEAGEKIDKSYKTISAHETGRQKTSLDSLLIYSELYNVPLGDLLPDRFTKFHADKLGKNRIDKRMEEWKSRRCGMTPESQDRYLFIIDYILGLAG